MDYALIALGALFLYLGGEGLVRGASSLGRRFGLSHLVIGLTIVSCGTSSPELAASLASVFSNAPAVAIGNVVGSNIANLALVLGLTAIIWPIRSHSHFLRRDVPFMLVVSALLYWIVWNGWVGRFEGVGMLVVLALYLRYLLQRDGETAEVQEQFQQEYRGSRKPLGLSLLAIAAGIAFLVLGAKFLVGGAVGLARDFGISERVIGLTVVAFGTSLPELASSIVAAMRKEGDIVLGNLIGSNIFNVLFILGTTSLARPILVDAAGVWIDLGVMMAVSFAVWLFLATQSRLSRWEGLLLVASYVAYAVYLFT